jgi:tetratricopeptide (TPR) repeat protein
MHRLLLSLHLLLLLPLPAEEATPLAPGELPPINRPLDQATVFARQATEAMRSNNWKKAAESWEALLKLQPDSAAALANLGSVEIKLDKPVEARAHLEKAVALRPNLPATWMTLGLLHMEQKNPMLGISCLTRAIHEDPSDARFHNALAIALKQVSWTGAAEQELQKAIDLNSEYTEAHFNLALLYLEQKPPALESARRHYFFARDLGSPPDELVEKQFADAGIVYTPPAPKPMDKPAPKEPEVKPEAQPEAKPKPKAVEPPTKPKPRPKSATKPKSK